MSESPRPVGVGLAHHGGLGARDRLLALTVVVVWGVNFLAADVALRQFPPLLLTALRFAVLAIPTLLLVRPPKVPWRWLVGYGLGFGIIQFVFMYWGMSSGMPTGLASLVMQTSAPFTVVLGAVFLRERLGPVQLIGLAVAVGGLVVVGTSRAEQAALLPFLLTLIGALGWALGNLSTRLAGPSEPLRFTLWMSVIPPVPMFLASLLVDGPGRMSMAFTTLDTRTGWTALIGLAFTVVIATLVGSGLWSSLLARHPAGVVAPYSLLVPVVGITGAWLLLGEVPRLVEIGGAVLVVLGVALGSFRFPPRRRPRHQPLRPARTQSPELRPEP